MWDCFRNGHRSYVVGRNAAGYLRGNLWKLAATDDIALREHNGSEDRVFELAHISGPLIGAQKGHCLGAQAAHTLAFLGREADEEMACELGNVLQPLTQRRHGNRKDVQTIKQILAKAP